MSKTIEITIAPNGQSRVETKGFVGNECLEASRFIERSLGQHLDEQLTSEFYASQKAETQQHHNQ
ncbi:DUF2997 domain-containing protein [Thalassoglobus polymorphus]|uniref:DUF2997 domain-containing protein n=1 Tax=Thalassoglobus polymorphus TaxID=2527994 RepID=A0A517QJY1_9PLAN|nr:DUF2997 domain-containing protein [Thalassoglobus polymorphus]QDT31949.1 hypothetical protein Mal48_11880 [Thalassoglobus polymorphus]